MSDAAMYAYIKKLVHSLLKSTWKKQQKAAEKAAKKAAEKAAQKAAEKGPRQQKQRPQLEDDGWTIVTYSKSRRKHPHTAPEKRVPEKRGHHIVMKHNQKNKEKANSSISSCSSLVVNPNTHSRALPAVLAHPDTQAQMSVANKPEFVKEFKESQVTLVGIGKGSGIPAHIAKLSFVLQAENKSTYTLETEGVYSKEASAVVLSHENMRRAGLRVDYDEGRISTPDGQTIKMKMIDSVWTVPVRPSDINVTVRAFHTAPGPNTLVVTSQPKPQYIKYHEALFLPGVTKFFIQYDATKDVHCVKTTKTEMCQYIETHPSISMGLGTSKYARRRQKKCKKDRSENPNKVQDPSGKALLIPATSAQVTNGQETSISAASDDSAPCLETQKKGEDRTKILSNKTSENKKTKNDGASGLSTATYATSLDISD